MIYKHYKTGNLYELVAEAKHSETQEELIVYKSLKTGEIWVRPRVMFFGTVTVEGQEMYRFALMSDSEVSSLLPRC